ncbi:MAG: glycosyltransferase [Chthonomonadales bacterium]|nr:glycosyltransferase [Chthonomonadales bacterium]
MPSRPMVTCIMPTRDRRALAGQAVAYFMRQDYAERELIVVDDGDDAVGDLLPADPRVRYVRLSRRAPRGAKRNLACDAARGDVIAHWDDDDWAAPGRLSALVAGFEGAGAEVCGAPHILCYSPAAGQAWLRGAPADDPAWLAGPTLAYRRDAWRRRPFADASAGEDRAFLAGFEAARTARVSLDDEFVAVLHAGNAGAHNTRFAHWRRRSLLEVTTRMGPDLGFYAGLRDARPRPIASARPAPGEPITVVAPFGVSGGYGSLAEYLVLGMARAGARVQVVPLSMEPEGLTEEFLSIWRRSRGDPGPLLFYCWPGGALDRYRAAPDLVVNTMWESSLLPAAWVEPLSRARVVIVPSRFLVRACRESGLTMPVDVAPEGVDPAIYHLEERPERAGLTTLMVGPYSDRKHTDVGIAAWKEAFDGDPDARLMLKAQYGYRNYSPDDPRIQYVDRGENTRGIAHWYRRADVLMALGNEGFGLPLVEGMATGLPVVALDSEGQADVCAEARDLLLPVPAASWERGGDDPRGFRGVRGLPCVRDVADRLRWVARHRAEARAMGRAASEWAVARRSVWTKGEAVLSAMERHLAPRRALRRRDALWAPSLGTPCGVAEYTAHLAAELPGASATSAAPDLRGARVLHVQHEFSLFRDHELAARLRDARRAGVPVAITEHTVRAEARAWEAEANLLAALTRRGAEVLRRRWPDRRVEWLPVGCPTWFPPRKARRGRVIASFGFLGRHKGFWRLLEALPALGGAELLLFSHARSAEAGRQWDRDACGLPARRVSEFLPAREVVTRLAAEADALVFWYDEIQHASASYAVRVGLAAGVPVLVSPTSWFEDLREVTYQPEDLTSGIWRLLEDDSLRESLGRASRDFCCEHSWPRVAERHLSIWRALERG